MSSDALKGRISLTFDDKAGVGGSRVSGAWANAILERQNHQEIALEKALQNS